MVSNVRIMSKEHEVCIEMNAVDMTESKSLTDQRKRVRNKTEC